MGHQAHKTVQVDSETNRDELAELLEGSTSTEHGGRELVAETCETCGANVMVHAWHSAGGIHVLGCAICDDWREA